MGFNKFLVGKQHMEPDRIEWSAKYFLKADVVIGDPETIEVIKKYIENNNL